jgi:hypothetical protein
MVPATLAWCFTRQALGDLTGARDLLEQTLTTLRRVLGDDHPITLTAMNNLAQIQQELEAR